ncbi:MAG: hypothetical protein EP297_10075 [Gammaproteobacteria bacterium]|nr:MAG: hypothetical protein EP297_10075 [Gammaproteobacteria bacterium]
MMNIIRILVLFFAFSSLADAADSWQEEVTKLYLSNNPPAWQELIVDLYDANQKPGWQETTRALFIANQNLAWQSYYISAR